MEIASNEPVTGRWWRAEMPDVNEVRMGRSKSRPNSIRTYGYACLPDLPVSKMLDGSLDDLDISELFLIHAAFVRDLSRQNPTASTLKARANG